MLITLTLTPPPLLNTNDIDNFVDKITLEIQTAKDEATTIIHNNEFFKLDPNVRRLIRNKNRARKTWQRSRNPEDKVAMNRAQQDLKNLLQAKSKAQWNNFTNSLTPDDNSIWKIAKKFKSNFTPTPPIKIDHGCGYACTDEEKAEAIAKSLEQQFQLNEIYNPEIEMEVNTTNFNFFSANITPPDIVIHPLEVLAKINSLSKRKSPGKSKITNEMLKELPTNYILKITNLINAIFKFSYFPYNWKTAIIAPIHKPGSPPDQANSYRPISLLNCISKLTESFIADLVKNHVNNNNILPHDQFAFRENLSAPHQVYRLIEHITAGKLNKNTTAALFLDISKAFDKVWIDGLIYKLIKYNFPPHLILILKSYLHSRNYHVKLKSSLSKNYFCESGLPQGSLLSPTLFLIYIADLPRHHNTKIATFADDTLIYATNRSWRLAITSINNHLKLMTIWFNKWKIALNVNKTQAVLFSNIRPIKRDKFHIKINGRNIPWSPQCKYLGVTLDYRLTFKNHIYNIRKNFRAVRNKLYPLISRKSELSLDNKLLLYNSYLRPLITYASPAWSYAAKTHINLLIKSQNATIRQIVDVPYYVRNYQIYREINTPKLGDFIQHLNLNFYNSLITSDNPALNEIETYDHTDPINRKRPLAALRLTDLL